MASFSKAGDREKLDAAGVARCRNWQIQLGERFEYAVTLQDARKMSLLMNMDAHHNQRARIYAVLKDGRKIEVK